MPHAHPVPCALNVTADIVPINGTPASLPLASRDAIDLLLIGRVDAPLEPITGLVVPMSVHPLDGVEDVKKAAVVIGEMIVEDRQRKEVRLFPRQILRQQHIAAYMLVNPFATTTEICAFFSIGPQALTNIAKSDTFKSLIASQRISIETSIGADLNEQLRATLQVAIDVTQKGLITNQDPDYALAVLDKTANRLGLGAKHNTNVQINNNIVTPEMIAEARARRSSNAP